MKLITFLAIPTVCAQATEGNQLSIEGVGTLDQQGNLVTLTSGQGADENG